MIELPPGSLLPVIGLVRQAGCERVYRYPYADAVVLHEWAIVQGLIAMLRPTDRPDDWIVIVFKPERTR